MGKALYGKKQPKSSQRSGRRHGAGSGSGLSHWLTLAEVCGDVAEQRRQDAIVRVLREVLGEAIGADMEDSLAGGMVEYACEAPVPDNAEAWCKLCERVCDDAGVPLRTHIPRGNDSPASTDDEGASATELVGALHRAGVLCAKEPPLPPPSVGDPVLAVLAEDDEWHAATIAELPAAAADGAAAAPAVFVVRFVEWDKLQRCSRAQVVPLASAVHDEEEEEGGCGASRLRAAACCELCERRQQLTFHHLIPKQVHERYVGRPLPPDNPAMAACPDPNCVPRGWLHHHGSVLCTACHAMVHRLAPNATLAARYSSLEALRAEPAIEDWVAWARGQRRPPKVRYGHS